MKSCRRLKGLLWCINSQSPSLDISWGNLNNNKKTETNEELFQSQNAFTANCKHVKVFPGKVEMKNRRT